jgi:hypothetical protein
VGFITIPHEIHRRYQDRIVYTRQQIQFGGNYLDSELAEVSHVSSEAAGAYNGIALSG